MDQTPIRNAATVILLRETSKGPQVLMGQRGAAAAFMPDKFVFPGGSVDTGDAAVPLAKPLSAACTSRLSDHSATDLATALAAAAIRELWEEAGLLLGSPGAWSGVVPPDWQGFAATGHLPAANALRFVFRAITPPGNARRFDARFFLADAAALIGDPDDFSRASDELRHLQWVPLAETRSFDLPFVTEIVLAEVARRLPFDAAAGSVPFFDNSGPAPVFRRLA